jgi:hypothetical protein
MEDALGRPCSFADQSVVEEILEQTKASHGSISAFLEALVCSWPFGPK